MVARFIVIVVIFLATTTFIGCESADSDAGAKADVVLNDSEATQRVTSDLNRALASTQKAREALSQAKPSPEIARQHLRGAAFANDDFVAPLELAAKFRDKPGALSHYLFDRFDAASRAVIQSSSEGKSDLVSALKREFNRQLINDKLYDNSRFPSLSAETRHQLQQSNENKSPVQLARLNWLLLHDAYKEFLAELPDDKEFLTKLPDETTLSNLNAAIASAEKIPDADARTRLTTKINEAKRNIDEVVSGNNAGDNAQKLNAEYLDSLTVLITEGRELVPKDKKLKEPPWYESLGPYLKIAGIVVLTLALVGVVAWLVRYQLARRMAGEVARQQAFAKIFEWQSKLEKDYASFKQRIDAESNESMRRLGRLESGYERLTKQTYDPNNISDQSVSDRTLAPQDAPQSKEEPVFPVSADDYLQRIKTENRQGTVVRPDFQNGILVKDPEGRGELVLIEDPNLSGAFQKLFVVPSVGEFQMKQDFYNYYDSFYHCDRPAAGNVWIINPAVVEKVNGGWQLREKGRLEVR
jgi:hypothetical protein